MKKSKTNSQQKNATREDGPFPGYPLYPSKEDIMKKGERVDVDLNAAMETNQRATNTSNNEKVETRERGKTKSDLSEEDLRTLGSDEVESTGDDEILNDRPWPVDFAGEDLDVPGSEDDDEREKVGSEDEENNSYSIGGDRHEDLEEDRS